MRLLNLLAVSMCSNSSFVIQEGGYRCVAKGYPLAGSVVSPRCHGGSFLDQRARGKDDRRRKGCVPHPGSAS